MQSTLFRFYVTSRTQLLGNSHFNLFLWNILLLLQGVNSDVPIAYPYSFLHISSACSPVLDPFLWTLKVAGKAKVV